MEEQVSVKGIGFRYGIIAAIIFVIYGLILQMTGLVANQAMGFVNYVILAVFIFLGHKAYKEKGDGFMSFSQGLSIGVIISLVSGVISSIFTYVYVKFVDDSMLSIIRDKAYSDMEARGMSEDQIEQGMKISEKFTSPEMILVFGIVGILFVGFIISLIVTLITRKNNPQVAV